MKRPILDFDELRRRAEREARAFFEERWDAYFEKIRMGGDETMRRRDPKRIDEIFERAAEPSRARVRRDLDRVGVPRIVSLLETLFERLYDPGLNVNTLKLACGVRDKSVITLFGSELGLYPRRYIEDLRLETAARLLRDSDVLVWRIAELVGYSSAGVFSQAFSRWIGEAPRHYREGHRGLEVPASWERSPTLQRVLEKLDSSKAEELLEQLRGLHPDAVSFVLEQYDGAGDG